MPYDLALSAHGDLVIAGNRDLAGISGVDLIDQRIRLRLRMRRGEWIYDEEDTMGSDLYRVISSPPEKIKSSALAVVREALREMSEISVDDIAVQRTERDLTLSVFYSIIDEESDEQGELQEFQVTLQTAQEAGG